MFLFLFPGPGGGVSGMSVLGSAKPEIRGFGGWPPNTALATMFTVQVQSIQNFLIKENFDQNRSRFQTNYFLVLFKRKFNVLTFLYLKKQLNRMLRGEKC
jgi:hypothetical protein